MTARLSLRKSQHYPGEQDVQDSLFTRIIMRKVASLLLGFTPAPRKVLTIPVPISYNLSC